MYRAQLRPALPGSVPREALPVLPDWFPLDPKPTDEAPAPRPYTPEERAQLRHERAVREACTGPYDEQVLEAEVDDRGPLDTFVPAFEPRVRYKLSRAESHGRRLVYRYDPTSPIHRSLMAAVEEAFLEAGPEYAEVAREGDRKELS